MDIATKRPMTVDEFLAWNDEQEFWHELDGENVFVVEACTFNHAVIASNLICMLGNQLPRLHRA